MDIYVDQTDRTKSIADVAIDGQSVNVTYWWSWRKKLTDDEFQDYLQLEAYLQLQMFEESKALAEPKATGTLTQTDYGADDTRNWYQNWLDNFIPG